MKRLLAKNKGRIFLFACILLLVSTGSVLAQEPVPELVHSVGVMTLPEGVELPRGAPVRPSESPSIMSWSILLSEDFESIIPNVNWSSGSSIVDSYAWGIETYMSHSADHSAYPGGYGLVVNDPRESYYTNDYFTWLMYNNPFDLSTVTEARLEFEVWLDTETYSDTLQICASADGSYYYCHVYSGSSNGWFHMSFDFSDWPYLGDLTGEPEVYIGFFFDTNETINAQGVFIDDLVVRITSSSAEPDLRPIRYLIPPNLYHPGDTFSTFAEFINVGLAECPSYEVSEYLSTDPTINSGDILISTVNVAGPISPSEQWYTVMAPTIPNPITPGLYYIGVMYSCLGDNETGNDTLIYANQIEITDPGVGGIIFMDFFESRDFTSWTRYNPGKTGLSASSDGAISGEYGACFYRPVGNDKRRQLIDETPVNQTSFSVRFYFDVNGLSMSEGERFRFIQVKMGAERPFFIVMKYDGGQYLIQLNTLQDDLTKVKTGWYVLTDEVHVIEVDWQAASSPGANDGYIELYLDSVMLEDIYGLDSDTLFIENFKIGYTSRLEGKTISGMFFVDEVVTSSGGYIGVP